MKNVKLYTLVSFFFISQIILGQSNFREFSLKTGNFCSKTLILGSIGYFFKEAGCEGSSEISFGRYQLSDAGFLKLSYLPFDSLSPVRRVEHYKQAEEKNSIIRIRCFSSENKPLKYFEILANGLKDSVTTLTSNLDGEIFIDSRDFTDVGLISFINIYGHAEVIKVTSESMDVYLNLPSLFLEYNNVKPIKEDNVTYLLKQDGLYDLSGERLLYNKIK